MDNSDGNLIYNDAINYVTGYVDSDVDGNLLTDISDVTIAYNNSVIFVSVITP